MYLRGSIYILISDVDSFCPSGISPKGGDYTTLSKIHKIQISPQKGLLYMCVGLPAKVVSIKDGMALVDASGAKREVSAELLDELDPGDYVMVHAGVAIAKITSDDEAEAASVMGEL